MCNHKPREAAMPVISPGVWCDPCLVPLVRALNEGGVPTIASCCGHGDRPGNIVLADERELFIMPDHDTAERLHDAIADGIPSAVREQRDQLEAALAALATAYRPVTIQNAASLRALGYEAAATALERAADDEEAGDA